MASNPFTFGNPIRDAQRFIGRRSHLQQIVNRLRASAHESTAIVGERRIGKTSLLKHLADKDNAAALGLAPEEFCLVYMDFQGLADITPERFWGRMLQKMERAICNPELIPEIKAVRNQENFDLFDLEDLFTLIAEDGLTVVLLLDEFEYVTQNPNFGSDFFGGLRALAIHHNLPLVTATRRELVDLCHSEELKGSPFFNIFVSIVLRPFSQTEVAELINSYLKDTGIEFSDTEQALVLSLGGGYPFFTQMAAHYLYDAKNRGLAADAFLEDVTAAFDAQAEAHYSYMWRRCSESEKITLMAVITAGHQGATPQGLPTLENLAKVHPRAHLDIPELLKRGLLVEDKQQRTYHLLSPSLERWIEREIYAPYGEEESDAEVMAWLADSGHGEVAFISGFLPLFKKKYWPVLAGFPSQVSEGLVLRKVDASAKEHIASGMAVFICYSRDDQAFADRLVADLHGRGIETWRDVDNIRGGRKSNLLGWRAAIEDALDKCAAMLIILSPGAIESREVQAEWNHFASFKRPIFPVIAHPCSIPFYLKIYQLWDLSEGYAEQVAVLGDSLQDAVQSLQ
jgi:AAA+ ATPase superfamily predicted ATPase